MANFNWEGFLKLWSEELLEPNRYNESNLIPSKEMIESEWLGYPGATENQIREIEIRLKTKFPPSYREFLSVTNGWYQNSFYLLQIFPVEEVDWFSIKYPEVVNGWIEGAKQNDAEAFIISDKDYFLYGEQQNPLDFREEYFRATLNIAAFFDVSFYLLNPSVVSTDGEWEAWYFNTETGAFRYRSFWEMMQALYFEFSKHR